MDGDLVGNRSSPNSNYFLAANSAFYLLNVSNTAPKTANETLREIGKPELSKYFSEQILAPYADPVIYLFLGGFILAIGMEKWNLHRRVALNIIKL